ncbi:NUDIX hydrolase [Zoogloea sp.]|uniref:NUDIX hydrolase n=1 Tax=Zoogloea sp. TaxID=49181 RepID=UPI0026269620|nr:NUDIX hydrolase [Zoogloea sp.]MDD3354138.1 NUDIX hydrolase [Zoogloea sp.]
MKTCKWSWDAGHAVVIPDGPMPPALGGIPFTHWRDMPRSATDWEALADIHRIAEPTFTRPKGKKAAAGVAVLESDGRIWLVAPSNAFGGYPVTFPKGTQEAGMSLQATALRETFEETGLAMALTHKNDQPILQALAALAGSTPP